MRISMLAPFEPNALRGLIAGVSSLERNGLDVLWVGEPYGFDAPTTLAFFAARTTRVQLGTGILPVYSRTPTLTAMTAAGLDSLSDRRAILGLGASGPQVVEGWHGVVYDRPLQRIRETVEVCRRVWGHERLVHDGRAYQIPLPAGEGVGVGKALKMMVPPVRPDIPIYIAALGHKTVEYAAQAADGWSPLFFSPSKALDVWGADLKHGTDRRAPTLGPLEICAGGIVAIGPDTRHLRDLARPQLALYIGGMGARGHNYYNDLFARYGYEPEARLIQDLYLAGKRSQAEAAIPDRFLDEVTLCGPRTYIKERLSEYKRAGVTVFNAEPVGGDVVRVIAELAEIAADA